IDGVDAFVGPLLKATATEFAALTAAAPQPRLVLNYLDELNAKPVPGGPFQFGIAIEDEAASLVTHMAAADLENVLVVHGPARWAQRAFTTLQSNWAQSLVSAGFTDARELTQAVGQAMQVSASEDRKRALANVLGEDLEFLPRARRDIDAVVALTSQLESQALIPALRFHFADNLPVYSTSQALRGEQRDQMRNFKATEMPLLQVSRADYEDVVQALRVREGSYAELYALGFDAYALATWLPLLQRDSNLNISAASGQLWLESGGRFRRHLDLTD
ncbi:MAG: penicillin-binding protein activator, partial [Pseudomonadota bacterium]